MSRRSARRWRATPSYFGCISTRRIVGTTAAAVWSPYVSASTSTKLARRRRGSRSDEPTTTTTWSVARATTVRERWRSTNTSCQRASSRGKATNPSCRRSHESFAKINLGRVPRESFTMCTRVKDLEEARVLSWAERWSGRRPKFRARLSITETPWRRMDTRRWWTRSIATRWRALSKHPPGSRHEGAF